MKRPRSAGFKNKLAGMRAKLGHSSPTGMAGLMSRRSGTSAPGYNFPPTPRGR